METEESDGRFGVAISQTSQRGCAPTVIRRRSRFYRHAGGLGSVHGSRHNRHRVESR